MNGVDGFQAIAARIAGLREHLSSLSAPAPGFTLPPAAPSEPAAPAAGGAPFTPQSLPGATGYPDASAVRASYQAASGLSGMGGPTTLTAPSSVPLPASSAEWAARLPERGRQYAGAIEQAANRAGVDPRLLASLAWQESAFRPDARSGAGAMGLTQLMPGTARELGVDPNDPVANLEGGARYLRKQIDRFGSVELALAAYNAGPGKVARAGGIPDIAQTQDYVRKVMGHYAELR